MFYRIKIMDFKAYPYVKEIDTKVRRGNWLRRWIFENKERATVFSFKLASRLCRKLNRSRVFTSSLYVLEAVE